MFPRNNVFGHPEFPDFLYVVDPSRGEGTLVQFTECRDEDFTNTVDARSTASSTNTTTVVNDATMTTLPQTCEVALEYDIKFAVSTSVNNADGGRIIRGYFDLRIDGDDCMWIERKNLWPDHLVNPFPQAGLAAGDVMVGSLFEVLACPFKPFFNTRETTERLRVVFPTGFAETFTLITKKRYAIYSSVAPAQARCVLLPGMPAAVPGGPIVTVRSSGQLFGPATYVPAGAGVPQSAAGQGIAEAGMSDYGLRQ